MTEEEKMEFEEFLKWKEEKAKNAPKSHRKGSSPVKVDVNATVDAKIAPSVNLGWYKKLTGGQKNGLKVYVVWFIVHILLLVSGKGRNGFFPRLYKDYDWWHQYTMPRTSAGMEKYSWALEWNIDKYGFPEFIIYVVLAPVVVYFAYSFYKSKKENTHIHTNH